MIHKTKHQMIGKRRVDKAKNKVTSRNKIERH